MIWISVVRFLLPYLIIAALAAAGSYQIASLKVRADYTEEISNLNVYIDTMREDKHSLQLLLAEANKATAVAKAQTVAAEQAQAQAQKHADELAVFSKSRMDKLAALFADATSCDDLLKGYWGVRK